MYTLEDIQAVDPETAAAITAELDRQNSHIELIASENWVSPAVMSAMGSVMTNKYAEGYPGHRYYGGCGCVDVVEELARERAKQLFGCEYANVLRIIRGRVRTSSVSKRKSHDRQKYNKCNSRYGACPRR